MANPVKELSTLMDEIHGGNEWRQNVAFQARIALAKRNINELQRFQRLVLNGLESIRFRLKWWHLYQRAALWCHRRGYEYDLAPRIKELCGSWERVIKFPNNLVFNEAKKEQAKFEKDYKQALAIFHRQHDKDSMEC